MANIQHRLREARYSKQQIRLSYDEFKRCNLKTSNYFTDIYGGSNKEIDHLATKLLALYSNPPVKDKHYKTNHKQVVSDYIATLKSNRPVRYLVLNKLIIPIAYFIINYDRYKTYEHIGITITTNILNHMRHRILNQRYLSGLIPCVRSFNEPSTAMYYPLVKPMALRATGVLRDRLYDLAIDMTYKYLDFHNIEYTKF